MNPTEFGTVFLAYLANISAIFFLHSPLQPSAICRALLTARSMPASREQRAVVYLFK